MAGYVFAIGGDTEIIRTCAERGIYSTRLNSLTSRPFEATLQIFKLPGFVSL